jgi:hypothetical protein
MKEKLTGLKEAALAELAQADSQQALSDLRV